jgi:hypothetical protein
LKTRVPISITPKIIELCHKLVPEARPMDVPVRPTKGAKPFECFANVRDKILASGGSIQHGWAIWEWPGTLVEAEFHAVWKDANGVAECVSLARNGEKQILFLADPVKVYEGTQTPNERLALRNDPVVAEYIRVATERDELFRRPDIILSNPELQHLQSKLVLLTRKLGGGRGHEKTPKERAEERKKKKGKGKNRNK